MRGRHATLALAAGVLAAFLAYFTSGLDRLEASRILSSSEGVSRLLMGRGENSPDVLRANLRLLRSALEMDRAEVAIPMSMGSHYLLLGRMDRAIEWYERALELEPRPNIHLNLGRALYMKGRRKEAARQLEIAVHLDPSLRREALRLGYTP